ncbi:MAG: glycosyltransferase family 9 protein [Verrucomicrobiota bacterium]
MPEVPPKPKLLVFELWRVGDLAIATPFIQAASRQFNVTVLAQSVARVFQKRFWPDANLIELTVPWTAFYGKYRLQQWPWPLLTRIVRQLRREHFDVAVSARWDVREHLLLWLSGARERLGYPNRGSRILLTKRLSRLGRLAHRYEDWWVAAEALGIPMPTRKTLPLPPPRTGRNLVIHTGSALAVRVWPLERYRNLARRLRQAGFNVQVICDSAQRDWWVSQGESTALVPKTLEELLTAIDRSSLLIGNDSGPGHLAALLGVPTFTFFGPQLPEWFAPIHPLAQWIEGKPCPFKQCFDYCRFPVPHCIQDISEQEAEERINAFLDVLFGHPQPHR